MTLRVTLDTNVLIAAFIARGVCFELLEHCVRVHRMVLSEFILEEFARNLQEKFAMPKGDVETALRLIRQRSELVAPAQIAPLCRDPDDDQILGTALAGKSHCIVTGDRDLLELEAFEAISVLTPKDFWAFEAAFAGG